MFKQLNTQKIILFTTLGILCSVTGCGNTVTPEPSTEAASSIGTNSSLETSSSAEVSSPTSEESSAAAESRGTLRWPKSELASLLPLPDSTDGETEYEYSNSFYLSVYNVSLDDFNTYADECYDSGFSVNYSRGKDYYYAEDAAGNYLSLGYETGDIMSISLSALYSYDTEESSVPLESLDETVTQEPAVTEADGASDEMRPEFKEAMDQYEDFINEYCDFMKKYAASDGTDPSLLMDYAKYVSKYAEMQKAFDAWDGQSMNTAETSYYIEVQARASQKLVSVSAQ